MTYDQKVPMILLCVFPDACPEETLLSVTTTGFTEENAQAGGSTDRRRLDSLIDFSDGNPVATIDVALNGQDFVDSGGESHEANSPLRHPRRDERHANSAAHAAGGVWAVWRVGGRAGRALLREDLRRGQGAAPQAQPL